MYKTIFSLISVFALVACQATDTLNTGNSSDITDPSGNGGGPVGSPQVQPLQVIAPNTAVFTDGAADLTIVGGQPPFSLAYTGEARTFAAFTDPRKVRLAAPGIAGGVTLTVTDADGRVAAVQFQINERQKAAAPNDPLFAQQWALNNAGVGGLIADSDMDALEGWVTQTDCSQIVVAVIDTGVDYNHPDLDGNIWSNSDEVPGNGMDDDANGYIDDVQGWDFAGDDNDPMDEHFHGTHVAGTIGAEGGNGVGVAGVCHNATIMPLRFLDADGFGALSDAVEALDYAVDNGARVSNNSYGGGGFMNSMFQAITRAQGANHLFVAAAGNDDVNIDVVAGYPAGYSQDNIISVAAHNSVEVLTTFTNYGQKNVDLAAPGQAILSTFPVNTTNAITTGGFNTSYDSISGTSMATPHVAGAAALYWASVPDATNLAVKARILDRVERRRVSYLGFTKMAGKLNLKNLFTANYDADRAPARVSVAGAIFDDSEGNGQADIQKDEIIGMQLLAGNVGDHDGIVDVSIGFESPVMEFISDSSVNMGPFSRDSAFRSFRVRGRLKAEFKGQAGIPVQSQVFAFAEDPWVRVRRAFDVLFF